MFDVYVKHIQRFAVLLINQSLVFIEGYYKFVIVKPTSILYELIHSSCIANEMSY